MAKDLRLDVVTSSDGKGLIEAAVETEHLAHKVDDLGDKMRRTTRDGGLLAVELEATKLKMKEMAAEFDYSGDKALLKQISSTRRYSGQLEKLQKDLEHVGGAVAKEGEKVGADLADGTSKGFLSGLENSSIGPLSGPVLLGALTSPGTYGILADAGVMLGGAVLTGIGLAGIGTGIALSINSQQVQTAIDRLKADVSFGLGNAASSFDGPLTSAVDRIDAEFARLMPSIKADFAAIAPEVDKLGAGASGFLDAVVPAVGRAIVASKPLLDLLATALPDIGRTVGHLFDTISANSGAAELGLQEIIRGVEAMINLVSGGIVILSEMARDFNYIELQVVGGVQQIVHMMVEVADAAHIPDGALKDLDGNLAKVVDRLQSNQQIADGATLSNAHFAAATELAAGGVDGLTVELENFNLQLDAMNGRLNRTEALNNLTIGTAEFVKQLKDSKGAFDASTVAGALNQNSYIGLIKKAESYRDTLIKSGSTQAAADLAFQNMVKTIDAAAIAAGASASQIADLNKQLGITEQMKPIDVHVNVKTAYTYTGQRPSLGHDIPFLASGGHFDAGPIVVGEHGPELLVPDSAGTIIPNMGSGGGGHAPAAAMGGTTVVQLAAAPGDSVAEFILSLLRPVIRGPYGGDVTAALAGNRR